MKPIALTLAFLLELIAFYFFVGLSLLLPVVTIIQILVALLLLGILIYYWSVFMSPKAKKKLTEWNYYGSKFVIYTIATYSMFELTSITFVAIFIGLVITDELIVAKNK